MLSPKSKRFILQIIPFGVIPGIFSIVYSLLERGILGNYPYYPATGNVYNFSLLIPTSLAMVFGSLIGVLEVLYLNKWFQKRSFLVKITSKTLIYLALMVLIIFLVIIISTAFELHLSPLDTIILEEMGIFFSHFAFWSILIYFTVILVLCLFFAEVSDNIGLPFLINFFTGRYHHPIEEDRIFMFLDMKSSTVIAEKLGHVKYFRLLKEYYANLSDAIVNHGGEIYQYVGDEVVVTWKLKDRIDTNSIQCFYSMKAALEKRAQKYSARYEVVPTFKAGIHLGKVTAGEIGKVKKDIVFTGDVLNTTARIQGLCNSYGVDLLLSEKIVSTLKLSDRFEVKELGETELRGKNERVNLYTIVQ